ASISTPVRQIAVTSVSTSIQDFDVVISTLMPSIGIWWQNGMMRLVSLAACIAATFATPIGSAFGSDPVRSARIVAAETFSRATALATRRVTGFPETSLVADADFILSSDRAHGSLGTHEFGLVDQ